MINEDWPYPRIVAHRGGGNLAPENTLAAIDCGYRYGHTMIEFDAKLSADQQVFLLHDDTLTRTSHSQGVAGEMTWKTLQQVDAGSWFSKQFAGEGLAHLADVAKRCQQYGLFANIEIKPTTGLDAATGTLVACAAADYWREMTSPLLSSFSFTALFAAMQEQPDLPRGYLMHEWQDDWLNITQQLACVSLHLNYRLLTPERIAQIKQAGLRILAYTVNDPHKARALLDLGVDAICTDCIDQIGPHFPN